MKDLKGSQPAGEPVKRERSDKPLTAAEMADKTSELNKGRLAKGYQLMRLENYCVTPMAQDWLEKEGYANTRPGPQNPKSAFNYRLRSTVLIGRAKNLSRQLTLAETQEAAAWLKAKVEEETKEREQIKQLRDVRIDETVPETFFTEGKVTCDIGEESFDPKTWTALKDGKVIESHGEALRNGNFVVVFDEEIGRYRAAPICRDCAEEYREALPRGTDRRLFYGHPYADAARIAEEMTADMAKAKESDQTRRTKIAKYTSNVNALGEVNRSAKLGFRGRQERRRRGHDRE